MKVKDFFEDPKKETKKVLKDVDLNNDDLEKIIYEAKDLLNDANLLKGGLKLALRFKRKKEKLI